MSAPPHLLSEYEDVQPIHRRILAFSFIGWIFDFYDLLLLSFVVASTSLTKDLALSAYDVSVLLGTALAFTAVGGFAGALHLHVSRRRRRRELGLHRSAAERSVSNSGARRGARNHLQRLARRAVSRAGRHHVRRGAIELRRRHRARRAVRAARGRERTNRLEREPFRRAADVFARSPWPARTRTPAAGRRDRLRAGRRSGHRREDRPP